VVANALERIDAADRAEDLAAEALSRTARA